MPKLVSTRFCPFDTIRTRIRLQSQLRQDLTTAIEIRKVITPGGHTMSGRRLWFSAGLLTLIVGVSHSAAADETKYRLAYQFQAGQFYHYDVDDHAEIITQYGENQSRLKHHTQILKSFRVVAVDENGGATIEPITEIIKMATQTADKPAVIYDSTKAEETPKEYEKIASMIGRPLARFQLAASGRLMKVTMLVTDVPKNFVDAAAKTDPAINLLVVFPEQPVKIGDKWTEKYETQVSVEAGLNRPINLIRSYELIKVDENIATIQVRTSLLTPTNDPEILRQLVEKTPTGTIDFDLQQGRLLNKSLKIDEKVVGAFGAQSLLQAVGEMSERLVFPGAPRVSSNPPNQLPK